MLLQAAALNRHAFMQIIHKDIIHIHVYGIWMIFSVFCCGTPGVILSHNTTCHGLNQASAGQNLATSWILSLFLQGKAADVHEDHGGSHDHVHQWHNIYFVVRCCAASDGACNGEIFSCF